MSLSMSNEFRMEEKCMQVDGTTSGSTIRGRGCHHKRGNQEWRYDKVRLYCFQTILLCVMKYLEAATCKKTDIDIDFPKEWSI